MCTLKSATTQVPPTLGNQPQLETTPCPGFMPEGTAGLCVSLPRPSPPSPRSLAGLSIARLKHLFDSMTFSSIISSLPLFVFFHFGDYWILDLLSWFSTSIFYLWLYILANSRYLINVCSMNELEIKYIGWKNRGSELTKAIFQHKATRWRQVKIRCEKTILSTSQQPLLIWDSLLRALVRAICPTAHWPHRQWRNWRGPLPVPEKRTRAINRHSCSACSRWCGTPGWHCSVFSVGGLEPKQ